MGSSHHGSAETNLTSTSHPWPRSVGLRIWHCGELWCRSQMRLGSRVAVAMPQADSYGSDSTPSLGTSKRCWCGPQENNNNNTTTTDMGPVLSVTLAVPDFTETWRGWRREGGILAGTRAPAFQQSMKRRLPSNSPWSVASAEGAFLSLCVFYFIKRDSKSSCIDKSSVISNWNK